MDYTPKIKKEDLKHGHYYAGYCRNATVARWNGKVFVYWRTKFGSKFLEEINCPEDEIVYDVFIAERDLTEAHETVSEIPLDG